MSNDKERLLNLLHDEMIRIELITNELKRAADHYSSTDADDEQFEFNDADLSKIIKTRRELNDIARDCFFIYLD
ncbi:hypothetical protein [Endozoicomonas atrinae]|uniref:hypothetical protein n=1 Tax=Endozoicomonas atrinae TaxID=1333660 RepID=UPI0008240CEC|nr:hypothetical protein [Endozoicomonas atrinae]